MKRIAITLLVTAWVCAAAAAQQPAPATADAASQPANLQRTLKAGDAFPMGAFGKYYGNGERESVFLMNYCGKDPAIKAVVIHFFSAARPACVPGLHALQTLTEKYQSSGLRTLAVSIDPNPREVLPAFLKKEKLRLTVLTDKDRLMFSKLGFADVPQTILISSACKTIYVAENGSGASAALESRLRSLLGVRGDGTAKKSVRYVCPMSDYEGDKPGKCPKCGMTLVRKP